jgi:hypothetical protein
MSRIWFWKPQRYWFGWRTLIPFLYGHDQYARRTLLFGWTITGRVIIAVWGCGSAECEQVSAREIMILERAKAAFK